MKGITLYGYLLFGICGIIAQVRGLKCGKNEFKCDNKCIDNDWKCDGDEDCDDGTDEVGCTADKEEVVTKKRRVCDPSVSFECKNKKCFPHSYTCDYMDDCGDGSDESTTDGPLCERSETCPDDMFQCKITKECIHRRFVCDKDFDCGEDDKSDEESCGADQQCIADDFKCDNGICIDRNWLCDYNNDCGDRSDERNCDPNPCSQKLFPRFKCVESGHCIFTSLRCNGENDCLDGSDELHCKNVSKPLPKVTRAPGVLIELTTTATTTSEEIKQTEIPETTSKKTTVKHATKITTPITTTTPTTTQKTCGPLYLTCPSDNSCVHKLWKCDGQNDCPYGYDESDEICQCEKDEFKCLNNKCISLTKKCDGVKNCEQGEDESVQNCPATANCTGNNYHCKESQKCILKEAVCDSFKNCPHGDDEGTNCGINECLSYNGGCSHECVDTKLGHYCTCPKGYVLSNDQKTCTEINECEIPGFCSQSCRNLAGTYVCECDQGYILKPDKKTCKALGPKPYLLFTNGTNIRKLSTNFLTYHDFVPKAGKPSSIDYDLSTETVYWSDNEEGKLKRFQFGSKSKIDILKENIKPVTLKVDWIGRKLYWTEKDKIHASNLDGSNSKIFIQGQSGEEFQGLAVLPEKGYIYWSDIGDKPKVERASLDGTNRMTLFDASQVKMATFLTVDRHLHRLYWSDYGHDHIASSKLDGSDVIISTRVSRFECSLFGLTVFEDYIYWSCKNRHKINKANKFTGELIQEFKENIKLPLDVAVYHPLMQKPVLHPCQTSNGGCSHLCFVTNSQKQQYTCDCPDQMKLYANNKTCIPKNIPKTVDCGNGFMCTITKRCIPREHVCDGNHNCEFGDDEVNCVTQPLTKAPSKSNKLIPIIIGVCLFVLILIIIIVLILHYRKKQNRMVEMSMVFQKDTEIIMDKDELDKDFEQKYVPTNTIPKYKKNFSIKNYDESKIPLHIEMDLECMVDDDNGDCLNEDCDTRPIIT